MTTISHTAHVGPASTLGFDLWPEGSSQVLRCTGVLDLASADDFLARSTAGSHASVVIDLAGVTFMDCSGFDSVVASRLQIEGEGRTLLLRGATGQPARLVELITENEAIATPMI